MPARQVVVTVAQIIDITHRLTAQAAADEIIDRQLDNLVFEVHQHLEHGDDMARLAAIQSARRLASMLEHPSTIA